MTVMFPDYTPVVEEKSKLLHDLGERIKELNCLYDMSRLVEKPGILLDDVLQGTAELLPPAMQYPDNTCARIVVDDREFSTKNFKETGLKLRADIIVFGERVGFVDVRCLEERPTVAEGPFLEEEGSLVVAVAERLGRIIERVETEKVLRGSEARLNAIFEGANDGILVADVKTNRFFSANPRICEITGYSSEELLKLSVGDIHLEKDLPYVVDSITKQIQGKQSLAESIPVLRKDGIVVYCDVNSKPIMIEGGEYLVGFFRDITERKKAEEALRMSEKKLRSMFDASPDAITLSDSYGRVVDCNPATAALHGYESKEELVGKNVFEFIAKKDHQRAQEGMATLGPTRNLEYTFVAKDGREFPAELSANVILDASGKPAYYVAITKDLTERRRVEREIRVKDYALDSSSSGVAFADLEGKLTYVNRHFLKMWGYASDKEVLGRSTTEFWVLEDNVKEIMKAVIDGYGWVGELTAKDKGGSTFVVQLSASLVKDESGIPLCMMGSFIDVTERKKMEEQLKANAENLESLLKQRTSEVIDAERLAAAGKVAAMLGHDLRSPIQVIKNNIYLLRESPGEAEERLKGIDDAANRMTAMVEELRADMRNPPIAPRVVDLGDLIGRCLREASVPPGVTTHLVVGVGLESVTLDPLSMRRVLDNLVRNAVEAMPGGGDLSVSAEAAGGEVVLRVSDTGVGIPEEMRASLFKAFNTSKVGGLGLGLAYVKRAVEAHGGVVTVESRVGLGSTFTVRLPRSMQSIDLV